MKNYIMDVHGFEEENIVILMDDGENIEPNYENIINAYKTVVSQSEDGDAIFLHYSGEFILCPSLIDTISSIKQFFGTIRAGHGTKLRDDNNEEADGYDEALCPR